MLKFRILAPVFLCVTPVHLFILCVHLYLFIVCGAWKRGMIFCSFLPLCLFDVPYVEGRGETRFFDVPREPLWAVEGPRCESDSLRPTPISGGRGAGGGGRAVKTYSLSASVPGAYLLKPRLAPGDLILIPSGAPGALLLKPRQNSTAGVTMSRLLACCVRT